MNPISQVILDAVGERLKQQGDSFRMRHKKKNNGDTCTSPDKDPAMVVTRVENGWIYYCQRCHLQGKIHDNKLSPGQTRARMEALKNVKMNKVTERVDLPNDFIQMTDKSESNTVPWAAYHWLWQYNIVEEDFLKYRVGWSDAYSRVIIPIYEFAMLGDTVAEKLVGWVGREVKFKSKEERKKARVPKYLTRAKKGQRRYFQCHGNPDIVVICEDCVSAMKVNKSTGYTTIALLQTVVGNQLMRQLRGKKIYLWLDSDMRMASIRQVNRMRQLGLDAHHIYTNKDPKDYNTLYIQDTLRGEQK
jgi:hypothetical protein